MKLFKILPILMCIFVASFVYANSTDFNLSDLDGKDHKLSDYKGKWVVVNYWATWCPPCIEEIPELVFFHNQHSDKDAVVIGINYEDTSEQNVKNFIEEYMVSYPILLSEPDAYSSLGKITGLPTTFIVSPDGQVVHKKVGLVDAAYLEKIINQYKMKLGKT